MKRLLLLWILIASARAALPDGAWLLKKLDANNTSDNKIAVAEMIVSGRRASRTMKLKTWVQGADKSFSEFLAPAREAGAKMLKLGDELWTYSPNTDRTIKIAGHMLRQSLMGSDLSYEDLMEDPRLGQSYAADVTGEDTVIERPCWVVELTAQVEDVAYSRRRLWVDRERYVTLKEERYARGGELLKTTDVQELKRISGRWVPTDVVFHDVLRSGTGTEFTVESIEFNAEIPDYIFSKAALKQ
jgi:outer membrane lipoprotein-sorting protein